MMILDGLVLAYVAYATLRGRKRGLSQEFPGAVSISVFAISGWGLWKILRAGLEHAAALVAKSVPIFTSVALLGGSFVLWRSLRSHLSWIAKRWPSEQQQRRGGAIAGGLRAAILSAVVLLACARGPTRWIVESSVTGRVLIRCFLPAYDKAHSG